MRTIAASVCNNKLMQPHCSKPCLLHLFETDYAPSICLINEYLFSL